MSGNKLGLTIKQIEDKLKKIKKRKTKDITPDQLIEYLNKPVKEIINE